MKHEKGYWQLKRLNKSAIALLTKDDIAISLSPSKTSSNLGTEVFLDERIDHLSRASGDRTHSGT